MLLHLLYTFNNKHALEFSLIVSVIYKMRGAPKIY